MALPTGSKLGPYEVKGVLGAGGMGEVYRAEDPRLSRTVAIKLLPERFAQEADRLSAGPLPLAEALEVARQIPDALEAAPVCEPRVRGDDPLVQIDRLAAPRRAPSAASRRSSRPRAGDLLP